MRHPQQSGPAPGAEFDLILVGGGLQSGLIALAVLQQAAGRRIAIVERDGAFGGNHTWCMHAEDVPAAARDWVDPLVAHSWSGYDVLFPGHKRTLGGRYAAVTSERLHAELTRALSASAGSRAFLGRSAKQLGATEVELDGGQRLSAPVVIDARGPGGCTSDGVPVDGAGFQKFLGLELRLAGAHGLQRPMLMDATVEQTDGFRFMYVLPFDAHTLLVEDTTFSRTPALDDVRAAREVRAYAEETFGPVAEVLRSEQGVLPMPYVAQPLGPFGDVTGEAAGRAASGAGEPICAGYRGGFFHPGTGYSMPAALAFAQCVADAPDMPSLRAAVAALFRDHRQQAAYAERLNFLLFNGFAPGDMWNVFDRFYRLPEPLIHRFYGLRSTALDRARILVGRPPRGVSIRAVLSAAMAQSRARRTA